MAGYVAGATATERPFQDLVGTLPDMLKGQASGIHYKVFGSAIHEVDTAKRDALLRPAFFSCSGGDNQACDNKETRLDLVLNDIARAGASPTTKTTKPLSVVVTDMWFADPGNVTSGLAPLAAPLTDILASGRTVAIFGIPSPFNGMIYDLPGGGSKRFSGRRPLMLVAIGTSSQVKEFTRQLERSPSQYLATGVTSGSIKQALFTLDPSSGVPQTSNPLSGGADASVHRDVVLDAMQGVRVQQFAIERQSALRSRGAGSKAPQWTGPSDDAFLPHAVWRGPLAVETLIWERRGDGCGTSAWTGPIKSQVGWSSPAGSAQQFVLAPSAFLSALPRSGVYLVTAQVARTSVEQPNPATAWLREWSFVPGTNAEGTMGSEPFHRTLNLSEFARLLENALADAAERKPGPITGFTFAVQIKD